MTSKEAIENIINGYHHLVIELYYLSNMSKDERDKLYDKYDKEVEIIQHELEVIGIIKKYIDIEETGDYSFPPYEIKDKQYSSNKSCLIMSNEEYKVIKEWLENGR